MNGTFHKARIGRAVNNIPELIEAVNHFEISTWAADLSQVHNFLPFYHYRVYKTNLPPLVQQCYIQTYVGSTYSWIKGTGVW